MRLFARAALSAFLTLAAFSPAIADDNLRTSAQALATGTLNTALVYDLFKNEAVMGVNVVGLTAAGATLTLEGSSDAKADTDSTKTWFSIVGVPFTCPSPVVFTTLTTDQSFKVDTSGLTNIRFRVSGTGTGNATIGLNAIPGATMGVCGGAGFSSDPCFRSAKLGAPINLTASGQIITGAASKRTYICSIRLLTATAQNIALVEGTGSVCATNIFGLDGGTTAATGWNFAANGGLAEGAGAGTVMSPSADTNATAANVCLLLSGSGQVSGHVTYVQQ